MAENRDGVQGGSGFDVDQVELIREVFRYARRFTGKRFVFQLSSAVIDSDIFPSLVKDLAVLHHSGIRIILVPGAGARIDELLRQFGRKTEFSGSVRISHADTMPIIKMAAFDAANHLMTELSSHQVSSVIGNWVRARAIGVVEGVDFQMTGAVERVSLGQIERILADNLIPILPCIGWNAVGEAYNISSNQLAAQLAMGLGAEKLFFITPDFELTAGEYAVDGENAVVDGGRLTRMNVQGAKHFAGANAPVLPAVWKDIIDQATEAARLGVERVHILDGNVDGVVLKEVFSTRGRGTLIHADPFEAIRPMKSEDIGDVLRLMAPGIESGNLLPRSREDLQAGLRHYAVFETDGALRGCGALIPSEDGRGEIAAMAVDPVYAHLGIGNKILRYFIEQARLGGLAGLYALTTRATDWFRDMGFERGEVSDLPEEKRSRYNAERNSRVFVLRLN
jgi:amino-acid N-acetyltransferase